MRHNKPSATRHLLRSAAGFALSMGLTGAMANVAFAQTTVGTATTTPLSTSAAGDITITTADTDAGTTAGSITLTDQTGPAITLDSDNAVINDGAININSAGENGVDNAVGVSLQGGTNRSFTQSGSISIEESFVVPTDLDDDILPDGPLAQGTGRTGILISGASPFEGNVELAEGSSLVVEGNDSFGINLDNTAMSQGGLTGNLLTDGSIAVTGNDSTAIRVAGDVIGDINNTGGINVIGAGSGAFDVTGNVNGGFINSGNIQNTGFRSVTRPDTATGPTSREIFGPEDLLNAGSAINIEGDISRGVLLEQRMIPVLDTDGNPVLNADGDVQMQIASTSVIQQFGSAPAIAINGNGTPIALGTVAMINNPMDPNFDAERQFAFINEGTLTAAGVFDDFDATVLSVADATLAGGISNENTLTAASFVSPTDLGDAERGSGIARVIVLGDQAIADEINNSGIIQASSSEVSDVVFADVNNPIAARDVTAIAIDIGTNASTSTITNSNVISAVIIGRQGEAVAIRDSSGTVTSLTNTGFIQALGGNSDPTGNSETDFDLIAVDVSSNTSGFIFNQFDNGDATGAPLRTDGDILLGSGDDTVTASAGQINGDIDFAGGDDVFALSGGTAFQGNIANTAGLDLSVIQGSSVSFRDATAVDITSATFDGTSNFNPVLDVSNGTASTLNATGDISFASGASVTPIINNIDFTQTTNGAPLSFDIAVADGDLTIGDIAALASGINPFLFDVGFIENAETLVITLDLRDPNAAIANGGLGLDAAQTGLTNADGVENSVFNAFVENLSNATELGNAFANITDANSFNTAYNQILPEIGAAARQFILAGVDGTTGAVGSHLDTARRSQDKRGGAWFQHFAYFADRELAGQSEQFRGDGFGFTGGVDTAWGPFHAVGLNIGFSSTEVEDVVGDDDPLDIVTLQGGAYAGLEFGNLSFSAYGGGGYSDFEQNRQVSINDFFGTAQGDWSGTHINGTFKAGYDIDLSDKYWIRPAVSVDYLRLSENAYTETGTLGVALDVDSRTSDVGSASAVINLGANFSGRRTWIKSSLRAGYKYDFINDPTLTSFRFAGGPAGGLDPLSLQTAQLQSFLFPDQGVLLGFTIAAGSAFSSVGFDFDSDIRNGFIRHTGRIVFRLLF